MLFAPGSQFHHDGRASRGLRLSIAMANEASLRRGVAALGRVLAARLGASERPRGASPHLNLARRPPGADRGGSDVEEDVQPSNGNGAARTTAEAYELKVGLAEMLKGGVIMDVTNADQAKIAEDAGAAAVMALERVPADIRNEGGVARMARSR